MKPLALLGTVLIGFIIGSSLALRAAESVPEGGIAVAPSCLVMGSSGVWVTVHADLPYRNVVTAEVRLNGIPAVATFADSQGDLVAKFYVDTVKATVAPPAATVELTALTKDGTIFSGSDTIRVVERDGR